MITESLFDTVLVDPVRQRADTLYIVSGYASATMVSRHYRSLRSSRVRNRVRIELIVGMTKHDGLSDRQHQMFRELSSGPYKDLFVCRYVAYGSPVHTKAYAWYIDGEPTYGFCGSANYTQAGFGSHRREALVECNPEDIRNYFDLLKQDTLDCLDPRVADHISMYREPDQSIRNITEDDTDLDDVDQGSPTEDQLHRLPHERVSFLDNQGRLPQRSGLNWGQRPELGREPNQAYIQTSSVANWLELNSSLQGVSTSQLSLTTIRHSTCAVRAQDQGKGIQTPDSNSRMGIYFRRRMNLPRRQPDYDRANHDVRAHACRLLQD